MNTAKHALKKNLMNILIGIIILTFALSFILVYANTHPPRYALSIPPSQFRAEYEPVSFLTGDGITLKGWMVKPKQQKARAPGIIIHHGVGANRSDFTELAVSLSKRGYYVLLFDFRAHGESGGRRTSLGYHEQKDAAAAYQYLLTRPEIDKKRIGMFGFSMGGAVAIMTAAGQGGIAALVVDSAYSSLRKQAEDAIRRFYRLPKFPFLYLSIFGYEMYFQTRVDKVSPVTVIGKLAPTPILIIAGADDRLITPENSRMLYDAAKDPKELWLISDADHGGTLAAAGSLYEKKIGEFFDRYLGNAN